MYEIIIIFLELPVSHQALNEQCKGMVQVYILYMSSKISERDHLRNRYFDRYPMPEIKQ
jgi:hypothetical protein